MARETVGLYIRLSSDRTYRKVNPKSKTQPAGTFCLRYKQHGKRIWRTVAGADLNLAIAVKKRQEAALLTATPKLFCQAHWSVYDLDDDGNELIACFSCDHKHPMNKAENHYWDCPVCLSAEGQPECAEFNRLSEQDERARAKFLAELAERKALRS